MNITKREYAQTIANLIGGEVNEVEKTNGIKLTGVLKREEGSNCAPTVYIDTFYDDGVSVDDAVRKVRELLEQNSGKNVDLTTFTDWEKVKPQLRARLYNEKTNSEVRKSANEYGFDDLVIIPYIIIKNFTDGVAGAKVTNQMLENWGVTAEEVIDIAMENSKKEIQIISMKKMLSEMMGLPEELLPDDPMFVITNETKVNGSISVILAKEKLDEMFPKGYAVLPSSIHEVIVVPLDEIADESQLTGMVNEVNAEQVAEGEQLGDRAYIFRAE